MTKLDESQTQPNAPEQTQIPAPTPIATPSADVERLAQERDTLKTQLADLKKQMTDKEKAMTEQQNAQSAEALKAAEAERDAARAEVQQLKLEKELTGKVLDPDAAIKLMGDGYRKQDGTLDVDTFLEKHPYMRPAAAPTAPNGGGGPQTGTGKDSQIEELQSQLTAAEKAGNRVLAVSLQSKLTALRQS